MENQISYQFYYHNYICILRNNYYKIITLTRTNQYPKSSNQTNFQIQPPATKLQKYLNLLNRTTLNGASNYNRARTKMYAARIQ